MRKIGIVALGAAIGCAVLLQFPVPALALPNETVLHAFGNGTDGAFPQAGMINDNEALYGTTTEGGTSQACGQTGCGTVFSLDPNTSTETVVYSFTSGSDGAVPAAGLIHVNGILYGTTVYGGSGGSGTVFAFDTKKGTETVLHAFSGDVGDGAGPTAGLIDVNGILYGTTGYGGNSEADGGAVFSLDPKKGTEGVLYSFCRNQDCTDGERPLAGLIAVQGVLYGTTSMGGSHNGGTVFSLDLSTGKEKVLYSFCSRNCADGESPASGLVDMNGVLYGTTLYGGSSRSCQEGCGVVFSLDLKKDIETVVHSFCWKRNCADGAGPYAGLIDVKGMLYGTTQAGGSYNAGTVFSLVPSSGAEKVLYSFCQQLNCTDGADPTSSLVNVNGVLYGTTYNGGAYCENDGGFGCGTVFSLTGAP